jgi:hypothetical protein
VGIKAWFVWDAADLVIVVFVLPGDLVLVRYLPFHRRLALRGLADGAVADMAVYVVHCDLFLKHCVGVAHPVEVGV